VMTAITELAAEQYQGSLVCARDFLSFDVEFSQ
jgi:hypothetical protein